jgi:anti-sigma regulatory factor (Ser/Thr protein kinase)
MEVNGLLTYATTCIDVAESSQTGEARRRAATLAQSLQFDDAAAGALAIVVTELATNIVKHGRGGQLLLNPVWTSELSWIDVVALDKGPGMKDFGKCMEDGYSSSGTAGNGLGAVQRMSQGFDAISVPGGGSVFYARVHANSRALERTKEPGVGVINIPKSGEEVCGDSWGLRRFGEDRVFLVADGLGHGIMAAQAAREAVRVFSTQTTPQPSATLQAAHAAMRPTRGAAVAIAKLDRHAGQVVFCGLGNIAGSILNNGSSKSMVSHNGIAGHEAKRFHEFNYTWESGSLLVMHSDGLQSQWNLAKYPGVMQRHPVLIAALLYRDFNRGRDDVTVLVAK